MINQKNIKIAVVGLGYVGLPLALAFSEYHKTIGFDVNAKRVADLTKGEDFTLEKSAVELLAAKKLSFTTNLDDIAESNIYIVTVPTPIDRHKQPDLSPLRNASHAIGQILNRGDIVIYESTVYPGATEEECVPVLEQASGLVFNGDFCVGYSPERINPGDKANRLETIVKVTSGSTPKTADFVDALYCQVITAGTHKAASIRVAEAAKVIENIQRDLNIALVNEFALIFNRLGIKTLDVLEAAGTKWNFLPFRPGLVGGHCIGVDPYYLTHKALSEGYNPKVILAGREINDNMGTHVVGQMVRALIKKSILVKDSRILVMGLTFKENCPDLRNTRVLDIVSELESFGIKVDVCDPWVNPIEAKAQYGVELKTPVAGDAYDGIIFAVAHNQFREMSGEDIRALMKPDHIVYDIKGFLKSIEADLQL